MRRVWVVIPLALLHACGSDTAPSDTQSYLSITTDTPALAETRPLYDSLTSSHSTIAYDALRFGMTENQISQLAKEERAGVRHIGSQRYTVHCLYNRHRQLYLVEFEGRPVEADDLDTDVRQQVYHLSASFRATYGMPRYLHPFPARFNLHPGQIRWMESWAVGEKVIRIGVSEVATGSQYKAICWIYHSAMRQAEEATGKLYR